MVTPETAAHVLSTAVDWSDVIIVRLAFVDDLGNVYTSRWDTRLPSPPLIIAVTPDSGGVGTEVTINGENFGCHGCGTEVTAVRFNGVLADFHVDSPTQITATVPAGATSGPVSVQAPGGTGQSDEPFTVLP